MTAVANSTFTAAQFNQYVRDNLNETAPAKATAASGYFVGAGVNSIAERYAATASELGDGTTSATSYGNLTAPANIGPSVTLETGPSALVVVRCSVQNSGGGSSRMAYEVSGATSVTPADNRGVGVSGVAGGEVNASDVSLWTALNPGINTFTARYRVSSGTGSFGSRRIIVFPL
ncbi:hypothetical protein [Streptomyces sp. OM5714]|uniref:hypothetical protein n=1 Tax=Streptomyces sp. OM5714 TaxID=2602736 RepID=UPI001969EAAA|nr:hypothetical protein [Streptomyces sp. OM5714]